MCNSEQGSNLWKKKTSILCLLGRISPLSAYYLPDIITDVKSKALPSQYRGFEYHQSIMYHWQHVSDGYTIVGMVISVD